MSVMLTTNTIRNTFNPTNTHSIFFKLISLLSQEEKKLHCDVCSKDIKRRGFTSYLHTHKHKNNEEGILGYSIENNDEAFKGHLKIKTFWFKECHLHCNQLHSHH